VTGLPAEPDRDREWVAFLQSAMPRLRFRWRGFRKVRGQVRKRIARRMKRIGLPSLAAYIRYLDQHPEEWSEIDASCRVTISRFYRDRGVFAALERLLLPELATRVLGDDGTVRCWSAGCACGEEPYTLAIVWRFRVQPLLPRVRLRIVATDADPVVLERARAGCYPAGALKELPSTLTEAAFVPSVDGYLLKPELRQGVEFFKQDLRREQPNERFHLVLCRNLAFTYFDVAQQREILDRIWERTLPRGFLVVGCHEALPPGTTGWLPWEHNSSVYQKNNRLETTAY
jgi:chemotaxis protein methyltransferase CheR